MPLSRRMASLWAVVAVAGCSDSNVGPNISGVPAMGIASVRVSPPVDTITIGDPLVSVTLKLTAEAIGRNNAILSGMRFVWSSSNQAVALVDSLGTVTALTPGMTVITASAGKVGRATIVVTGFIGDLPSARTSPRSP